MDLAAEKSELIKWINSLENPFIIAELNKIRKRENFDFDKEWEKGVSGEEIKRRTTDFLKTLPWKNNGSVFTGNSRIPK